MRVSLANDVPYVRIVKLMTVKKRWVGGNPSVSVFLNFLFYFILLKHVDFCMLFEKKRPQVKNKVEKRQVK